MLLMMNGMIKLMQLVLLMVDEDKIKRDSERFKAEMEAAAKDLPELDADMLLMLRYFYTTETLTGDIMEFASKEFQKDFTDLDVMNVAIFTLHGIITAAASDNDEMKDAVKYKLSGMVDNKYNLNEWLYTVAAETKAHDKAIYDCIKSGNIANVNAEIDKAVKEANYKAWKDELKVIKRELSAKDRIDKIKNGGA